MTDIVSRQDIANVLANKPDPRTIAFDLVPRLEATIELARTPEEANELRARIGMVNKYVRDTVPRLSMERWQEYKTMHPAEIAYVKAASHAGALYDALDPETKRQPGQNIRYNGGENFPRLGPIEAGFKSKRDATSCTRAAELDPEDMRTYFKECEDRLRHVTLSGAERTWQLLQTEDIDLSDPEDLGGGIIRGDFRKVSLPANSVDFIFTDPPYPQEYLHLYSDLSDRAEHWLKPGGVCVVYSAAWRMPEILGMMSEHLMYMWTAVLHYEGGKAAHMRKIHARVKWKPLHIFYKPPLNAWWGTFEDHTVSNRSKDLYAWQQPVSDARYFIDIFTKLDDLVLDPMVGVGTTCVAAKELGRKWLGIEADKERAHIAKERINDTG